MNTVLRPLVLHLGMHVRAAAIYAMSNVFVPRLTDFAPLTDRSPIHNPWSGFSRPGMIFMVCMMCMICMICMVCMICMICMSCMLDLCDLHDMYDLHDVDDLHDLHDVNDLYDLYVP